MECHDPDSQVIGFSLMSWGMRPSICADPHQAHCANRGAFSYLLGTTFSTSWDFSVLVEWPEQFLEREQFLHRIVGGCLLCLVSLELWAACRNRNCRTWAHQWVGRRYHDLRTVRRIHDRGSLFGISWGLSTVWIGAYEMSQLWKCPRCCDLSEQGGQELCSRLVCKAERGPTTV